MMSPEVIQYIEKKYQRRKLFNRFMYFLLLGMGILALTPLLSVFTYLISHGLPAFKLSFFTELPRPVGEPGGGIANAILGTLTLVLLGSCIGIPWGISVGLYLSEYGMSKNNLASWIRLAVDLLASLPSIIIGMFIYSMVVIPMQRFSALAGGLALGIIMIPTVARSVEESLKRVPIHIREAGLALGLPRWKVILHVVLAGSSKTIITGLMLSIARIAGETAPLLFTALSNRFWQKGLDHPIASLPIQIYNYAVSPYPEWHQKAWGGALFLVLMIFSMNLFARLVLSPPQPSGRSE